jgi:hypothetical protein
MRIHNIDIRESWDDFPVDYGLKILYSIIDMGTTVEEIIDVLRRFSLESSLVLKTLRILATGNLMDLLLMNKRLEEKVNRSYERENIKNFVRQKLATFDQYSLSVLGRVLINSIYGNQTDFDLDFLKNNVASLKSLNALKMDMYGLSRVFKTYDIYRESVLGAFQPIESKNIIIYAGLYHAENYVEFLEYLGARRTYSYVSPSVSCVKLWEDPPYNRYCGIQ